jgi:Amt family ammonium transporter
MVWGGDGAYLFDAGALDFAGGTVVHMNGGLAGLILAILVGKRAGFNKTAMKPFSIILTAVGASLLWFGWYGFNGGSAFGANAIAGLAVLTTTIATAAGAVTWMLLEWLIYKKPTLLGIASGIIAGLVAITPAAGFVSVGGSLIIGLIGTIVAFFGVVKLKKIFGYDDSLDAFGFHFLAGLWGALAVAFFAIKDQALLWDGPLKESGDRLGQFFVQVESVVIVGLWTLIGTVVVYYVASALTGGARVDNETEHDGLDETIHGEKAMNI